MAQVFDITADFGATVDKALEKKDTSSKEEEVRAKKARPSQLQMYQEAVESLTDRPQSEWSYFDMTEKLDSAFTEKERTIKYDQEAFRKSKVRIELDVEDLDARKVVILRA